MIAPCSFHAALEAAWQNGVLEHLNFHLKEETVERLKIRSKVARRIESVKLADGTIDVNHQTVVDGLRLATYLEEKVMTVLNVCIVIGHLEGTSCHYVCHRCLSLNDLRVALPTLGAPLST